MVRFAKVNGVESEPGWFPLPGGRRPGETDDGRPERCWARGPDQVAEKPAPLAPMTAKEERAANARARSAVDAAIAGLPPVRAEFPRCTILEATILTAAVAGQSQFDLRQDLLPEIDRGQLSRACARMERAGWLRRTPRRSGGKWPQTVLTATEDGADVLQGFLDFADSLATRAGAKIGHKSLTA